MDEYRVKVTVRNNLLLSAIENAGYKTQSEFARDIGISAQQVSNIVAMRVAPINDDGRFSPTAAAIMEGLGAAPSDLWTDAQLTMELDRNTGCRTVSERMIQHEIERMDQVMTLPSPEDEFEQKEKSLFISAILDRCLDKRASRIMRMRFGIGMDEDYTLDMVAKVEGVSRERVRQIEGKSMRKLRGDIEFMKEFGREGCSI